MSEITTETPTADTAAPEAEPFTPTNDNPYASLINPDGSFAEAWQENLGDDYADLKATAANYTSLPALLKGLKDSKTAAMARTDGMVRVPGENASPDDLAAYRQAMGIPESPDGYEIALPDVGEGVELDGNLLGQFTEFAHELNLTGEQAQRLVEYQAQLEGHAMSASSAAYTQQLEADKATLQQEWGPNFEQNQNLAARMATTAGLDINDPIFARPDVVKAFASLGQTWTRSIGEDRLATTQQLANKLSPESVAQDIIANPNNELYEAFRNSSHPQHAHAKSVVEENMKNAYPG